MRVFLFFLLLLSARFAFAQSTDSLAHYFIQHKLLTTEQFKNYKKAQKNLHAEIDSLAKAAKKRKKEWQQSLRAGMDWLDVKPEDDTLSALTKFLMVSSGKTIMMYPGWHINFQKDSSAIQVYPDSLRSFSAALFRAGQLNQSEWRSVQEAIAKKDMDDSLSVVMKASSEKWKTTAFKHPVFKNWLKQLAATNFLNSQQADSLAKLAESGELRSLYNVLQCSPQAVIIDLNDYPAEPAQYLKPIHEQVASLLPELRFDSFRYRIEINKRESFADFTSYQMVVDLWQKGKKYSMASFYSPPDDSLGGMANFGKIGDDFYQVFNKVLRNHQSPYRLFSAAAAEENKANYDDFAILALTEKQAGAFREGHLLNVSDENFTLPMTSTAIDEAIRLYREIGLFSQLKPAQFDSAVAMIEQSEINRYGDILSHFPNLIFEIDLEYGVDKGQYRQITEDLASVSRGCFQPTFIVDSYDYKKRKLPFTYGFTLNRKSYRTRLKQDDDWLDPGFWELIEKAVKEQDKKGRFHTVYPNDGLRVIYLTHEQYRVLKEKKLLELERVEEY